MINIRRVRKSNVWNKLYLSLEKIERSTWKIGWFGTRDSNGVSDAFKAFTNEYGSPESNIPPRPFIFNTLSDDAKKASNESIGSSWDRIGDNVANALKDGIKSNIKSVYDPPLATFTLMKRQERGNFSAKPLIDTGSMYRNIKVVRND